MPEKALSRQTMSGWVIQLHERLSPLMAAMKRLLYEERVIHIDETRLQVLNEPGRKNTQLSYMWVYGGGPPDKPVIWYQYTDTRSGEVPEAFLYPQREDPPSGAMYPVTTATRLITPCPIRPVSWTDGFL